MSPTVQAGSFTVAGTPTPTPTSTIEPTPTTTQTPAPTADFSATPASGVAPLDVQFTDLSELIDDTDSRDAEHIIDLIYDEGCSDFLFDE